jgi:hypothetical protein
MGALYRNAAPRKRGRKKESKKYFQNSVDKSLLDFYNNAISSKGAVGNVPTALFCC